MNAPATEARATNLSTPERRHPTTDQRLHARLRILSFPTPEPITRVASLKRTCDRQYVTRSHPTRVTCEKPGDTTEGSKRNRLAGVIQIKIVCVEIDTDLV